METTSLSDQERFGETIRAVQAFLRSDPGARDQLMAAAHRDPEGMTESLVVLGTVLLDIAAGAFSLTPEEMLEKVAARVAEGCHITLP